MSDFKRHLPADTSLPALHVTLNRLWNALEAQQGGGATTQVNVVGGALGGSSPSFTGPSAGSGPGSGAGHHNDLLGIQGGDVSNYYHLLASEYAGTGLGTFVRQTGPALVNPTATTPALVDNSTLVATTAFVKCQNYITKGLAYQVFLQRVYVNGPLSGSGTQADPLVMGAVNVNAVGSTLFLYNNCGGL